MPRFLVLVCCLFNQSVLNQWDVISFFSFSMVYLLELKSKNIPDAKLGTPNKEQNEVNKEQNWGKKDQNGASLGCCL